MSTRINDVLPVCLRDEDGDLGRVIWLTIWTVGLAYEARGFIAKDPDDMLSPHTRALFHTNTVWGRRIWLAFWGVFAAWFGWHIANNPEN